ncbi:MAG: Eco57I restriction-modification methylase domain-containing protein [Nitrospirota bacterium]
MDIFYFFIEHGLDLLKKNSQLGFIIQEYWVSRAHASKLRRKIFGESTPKVLVDFRGFPVFKEARGQHNMIIILEKSKDKDKTLILSLKDSNPEEDDVIKALVLEPGKKDVIFDVKVRKTSELYNTTTDKVYLGEDRISDLQLKLAERSFNLKDEEIQIGADVHQPFLRAESLSKLPEPANHKPGEGIFVLPKEEFERIKWTKDEFKILKPFHYAEELDKFSYTNDTEHYLIYTPKEIAKDIEENPSRYPNIKAHLDKYQQVITSDNKPYGIHRARQAEWFEDSQKIIGVRKTKYPKFVVVPEPYYMDQSVFIIRLVRHEGYSPYFINAILNSKTAHFWFYQQKRQGEQLQIDKEIILHFPIPRISFTTPSKERKEFFEEAVEMYDDSKYEDIIKWTEYEIALKRTDTIHDLLAFLAEQMIELNRSKNEEIKGFLKWLEREIGCDIDDIIGKTILKDYHECDDIIAIIAVLKRNQPKLFIDPSNRKFQETLEKHFNESISVLQPLKAKIEATDNLIDQIVYKLYGLTPEEIEIVEGKG